jgi:hypothetical protein
MNRARHAAWLIAAVTGAACQHAQPRPQSHAENVAPSRVALDSAEIDRLCIHPDSVRAGKADCVLKDQSARPGERLKSPPAPPR